MPHLPTVAIIGRPNTGKSTLFNRLIRKRRAIVSEIPGTTRDHIAHHVKGEQVDYLLLDTGGMGGGTADKAFEASVHEQSLLALSHADLILFTVVSREELTSSDHEIIELLRKKKRRHVPLILVPTKCDNPALLEELRTQYLSLNIADTVIPVSATLNIGIEELREGMEKALLSLHFGKQPSAEEGALLPRIAVIGKPNVGKSSIINALMSEPKRASSPRLVSEIPGTTRDTTDTIIRFHDVDYLFVDTAGLKRRAKTEEGIAMFASFRSIHAIEECDVTLLVLDALSTVSHQDQRIAGLVKEEGKGLIVLLNKIDLLKGEARETKTAETMHALSFCSFAPVLPCSTVSREGLLKVFPLIEMVQRNRSRRIPTHELHRWFQDTVHGQLLKTIGHAKHLTQADEIPPTFVLFVKNPKEVRVNELNFLENRLRETYDFTGTPVRFTTKRA